jgi:sugar phosphate isomerase/epimerase
MATRRSVLGMTAGMMAGAIIAPSAALAQRHIALGLQLYTVRDDLNRDFDGTLKQVAAIGYRKVQCNLTVNGRTAKQLRKIFDGLGLGWDSIHSSGDALRGAVQQTIDQARDAGVRNIVCSFPLYPADRDIRITGPSLDDWKRNADAFNRIGGLCRRAGLSFGYHNHNVEFHRIDGAYAYDTLIRLTDPALVQLEMDIGWVVAGGADPVAYLTKYPDRYASLHVKDLTAAGIPNTGMKMTSAVVGTGIVKWDAVLAAVKKSAVRNAYVELEAPYVPSPLDMVRASYAYLKTRL